MKNGLGALDRALDTLQQLAVEDDIPIFNAAHVERVHADGKEALDNVRNLCAATTKFVQEALISASTPLEEELVKALDRVMKAREGARA